MNAHRLGLITIRSWMTLEHWGKTLQDREYNNMNVLMIATVNVEIEKFLKGQLNDWPKASKQTNRWRAPHYEENMVWSSGYFCLKKNSKGEVEIHEEEPRNGKSIKTSKNFRDWWIEGKNRGAFSPISKNWRKMEERTRWRKSKNVLHDFFDNHWDKKLCEWSIDQLLRGLRFQFNYCKKVKVGFRMV